MAATTHNRLYPNRGISAARTRWKFVACWPTLKGILSGKKSSFPANTANLVRTLVQDRSEFTRSRGMIR